MECNFKDEDNCCLKFLHKDNSGCDEKNCKFEKIKEEIIERITNWVGSKDK